MMQGLSLHLTLIYTLIHTFVICCRKYFYRQEAPSSSSTSLSVIIARYTFFQFTHFFMCIHTILLLFIAHYKDMHAYFNAESLHDDERRMLQCENLLKCSKQFIIKIICDIHQVNLA